MEFDYLEESFLDELLKACTIKKDFFLTVNKVMNKKFLPEDTGYREVWEKITTHVTLEERVPSIGILKELLKQDDKCLEVLGRMKRVINPDMDSLIKVYGTFIKQNKFVNSFTKVADAYNKGERDEAFKEYLFEAEELSNFSLSPAIHRKVFGDFRTRHLERLSTTHVEVVIPTGIDMLDYYMWGGTTKSEATLFLGDSGTGKSQLLIGLGIAAMRIGCKVAHFQAEGTEKQVLDRYDAAWTGSLYKDIKKGNIPASKTKALYSKVKKLQQKGEVYVEAKEQFGNWSMVDIRQSLIEMIKSYGKIDMVIIDYLELIEPGDGRRYAPHEERFRQQAVARAIKSLATEFDVSVVTVTQASSIPDEAKQNKDFFLTRWNLSEDKGKLRPFDNLITINQTRDEKKERICRLFADKFREKPSDQIITIAQNFPRARFYDRMRTLREIYNEETLREIRLDEFLDS